MSLYEDEILEKIKKQEVQVDIYLMSGIKLTGKIIAYDLKVILLKSDVSHSKNIFSPQTIYKQAISTIVPSKDIPIEILD